MKLLVAFARGHWPDAFPPILPLPEPQSPFWHTFLGLLQLADWFGSDSAHDAFPFSEVGDGSRFEFARDRSKLLLTKIGFGQRRSQSGLWSRNFAREGRTGDQHDAYSIAAWLSGAA